MTVKRPDGSNRLSKEKSPYLLQHASNPVDWYPWGEEAFAKARNDGKPIFLSVGYSTCHWCHVLAHESFEDEATAAMINKNFIPIKVDREERPEVDAYYMGAVQAMTGGGGWPLSVFLTPELKPFYGGTYFPKEPRMGMPSFTQVLQFVASVWKEKKGEVLDNSAQIAQALLPQPGREVIELKKSVLDESYSNFVASFDPERGGFGGSPKFPLPLTSMFLLRYHFRTGKEMALTSVAKTLDEMMAGGIRDHVGGGFHRYSTDRMWLVPHFEKMLYDNALLAWLFTEGYQVTGKQEYAQVVRETLGWVLSEMRGVKGGFYSAQDADTDDGEGVYYTWTPREVEEVLGKAEAQGFERLYGVTNTGNFEGRSILHIVRPGQRGEVSSETIQKWKSELYSARLRRSRPATDSKVLTSWNGLAISAFARAGSALEEPGYFKHGREAAHFVLESCSREGKLLRRFAGGEAELEGTLEDYAFFVQGILDLFEATSEPFWLKEALRLTETMNRDFGDGKEDGLFLSVDAQPARLKQGYDGPTPSGNSVAAMNQVRLAELTGREDLRRSAEGIIRYFSGEIDQSPTSHGQMLMALDLMLNGGREVVITSKTAHEAKRMMREVSKRFLPDAVVLVATERTYGVLAGLSGLLEGRRPSAKPRAYVCKKSVCKVPADDPAALAAQLA
jgi:uncharacterized protein